MELAIVTRNREIRSRANLSIIVLDVNDNGPHIPRGNLRARFVENSMPNAVVHQLRPFDLDLPLEQTKFHFEIIDPDFREVYSTLFNKFTIEYP